MPANSAQYDINTGASMSYVWACLNHNYIHGVLLWLKAGKQITKWPWATGLCRELQHTFLKRFCPSTSLGMWWERGRTWRSSEMLLRSFFNCFDAKLLACFYPFIHPYTCFFIVHSLARLQSFQVFLLCFLLILRWLIINLIKSRQYPCFSISLFRNFFHQMP
jgi:hypothetical protein